MDLTQGLIFASVSQPVEEEGQALYPIVNFGGLTLEDLFWIDLILTCPLTYHGKRAVCSNTCSRYLCDITLTTKESLVDVRTAKMNATMRIATFLIVEKTLKS